MNFDTIATTTTHNTDTHLVRDEFDQLRIFLEYWNAPSDAGPQSAANCYTVLITNNRFDALFHPTNRDATCDFCEQLASKFTYLQTGYLETDPNYFRTIQRQKACMDCAERPVAALKDAFDQFKPNITSVEI